MEKIYYLLRRPLTTIAALALFSGCATARQPMRTLPLAPQSPANPQAREAAPPPAHESLALDATTRKTDKLLAAAEQSSSMPDEMSVMHMHGMDMKGMNMKKKTKGANDANL